MPGPLSTGPAPRWTVESDPQQLAPEWSGSAKPAMTLRQRAGPDQHRGKEPRQLLTRHAAEASADPRGGQPGVRFPEPRSPNAETDPSRSNRQSAACCRIGDGAAATSAGLDRRGALGFTRSRGTGALAARYRTARSYLVDNVHTMRSAKPPGAAAGRGRPRHRRAGRRAPLPHSLAERHSRGGRLAPCCVCSRARAEPGRRRLPQTRGDGNGRCAG